MKRFSIVFLLMLLCSITASAQDPCAIVTRILGEVDVMMLDGNYEKALNLLRNCAKDPDVQKCENYRAIAAKISEIEKKKLSGFTPRILVLYYSETGTTKTVALELQKQLHADIESIEPVTPYTGNFQETMQRGQREMQSGETPELKPLKVNIADYDVIFLGYPIWFGTYAMPIASLVKYCDFAGKTVVPFCTFGSGGLNTSTDALKKALPNAMIRTGYGVRTARVSAAAKELDRFLKANGYKKGEVPSLPDYSEQKPVSEEEVVIFNDACSSYQFPLGTPVTVGKRETAESTDYKYIVKTRGMNGGEATATIFVTVGKEKDAKPEFTEVVR